MYISDPKPKQKVITRDELIEISARIDSQLKTLANELEKQRDDIEQIKDRGFISRIANNNTRDLAKILLNQNQQMENFLELVQSEVTLIRESMQNRNEFFDPIEVDGHLKESKVISSIALISSFIAITISILLRFFL